MKKYSDRDIPQFTKSSSYQIDVGWNYLEIQLESFNDGTQGLDLDPDFQRAHVWSESQQKKYVEFVLRGGRTAKEIFFNCAGWQHSIEVGKVELVDGKQRLEAVRKFLRNELSIFDDGLIGNSRPLFLKDFNESIRRFHKFSFKFYVNDLETRKEVLQWYLDINAGGIAHTSEEIEKVKKLLDAEK